VTAALAAPAVNPCHRCKGKGTYTVVPSWKDGRGARPHTYPCPRCDGTGVEPEVEA
jgi:DnaJ-class molecular chaperone